MFFHIKLTLSELSTIEKAKELARYEAWACVVHIVQSVSAIDSTCSAIIRDKPSTPVKAKGGERMNFHSAVGD